jgi:PAS domain S-box-containing protein
MEIYQNPELQKYARTATAGTVIMSEGDRAESLYILIEGSLDVIKGGKTIYEIIEPGAFFGELSFLLDTVRIASVITAAEETRFLCLPNEEVDRIWQQYPEFSRQLARNIAQRLHETTNVAQGFREFCDRMPDAVIMTDQHHRVLTWNRAAEKLYGRTWHQMRGRSIEEIYDNQASFKQFMEEVAERSSLSEKALKIDHPSKEWFFVSTSTTVLRNPDGLVQGYLFIGRDATNLQTLEKKHRQVKGWLIPAVTAVAVLALVLGWVFWHRVEKVPASSPTSQQNIGTSQLLKHLQQNAAILQLALRPYLDNRQVEQAQAILTDYAQNFHPELNAVTGLLLLDERREITISFFPKDPAGALLPGRIYDGINFSDNSGGENGEHAIFLVSRPGSIDGQGAEVAFRLTDYRHSPAGWLLLHLNMDLVRDKFGCDLNELARALNS